MLNLLLDLQTPRVSCGITKPQMQGQEGVQDIQESTTHLEIPTEPQCYASGKVLIHLFHFYGPALTT